MRMLAHRGWWLSPDEKNAKSAFVRALADGHGIETDVRDIDGELVVSHDMPRRSVAADRQMSLDAFLDLYVSFPGRPMLALNIKATGSSHRCRPRSRRGP